MTSRLNAELAALAELASGLKGTVDTLDDLLTKLDSGMKRFESAWEGEAHDRFRAVFTQWRDTSTDLHRMLRGMHHVTHTAHGNYHAAETANRLIWGGE
ncbi:WXG100 family type VII secretion target [Streptomyces sp. NPDC047022]|uniref:WXG100 family type VII secretion target n=1 Tax=Streptomyces sp. NPDC047022 TaxID=3155737 RepID=UPI0033D4F836